MKYGYTRTSTNDKRVDDLQRQALFDSGVPKTHIHSDQVSGSKAASSRPGWTRLDARMRLVGVLVRS